MHGCDSIVPILNSQRFRSIVTPSPNLTGTVATAVPPSLWVPEHTKMGEQVISVIGTCMNETTSMLTSCFLFHSHVVKHQGATCKIVCGNARLGVVGRCQTPSWYVPQYFYRYCYYQIFLIVFLFFFPPHVEPSHRIEIASQSLMFDGDKTWHASEYFGGRRWSFVFFNMKHGMKSTKANATTTTSSSSSTTNPTTKGQREV